MRVVGGFICSIASTFFCDGRMPSRPMLYPRYSRLVLAKKLFTALIFNPASDNLVNTCSSFSRCLSNPSSVEMINKSSRYARANSSPDINSLIFSWKMSGLTDNPIGKRQYSYFPHGSTMVHNLLANGVNIM